jgi:hypothetical protein
MHLHLKTLQRKTRAKVRNKLQEEDFLSATYALGAWRAVTRQRLLKDDKFRFVANQLRLFHKSGLDPDVGQFFQPWM